MNVKQAVTSNGYPAPNQEQFNNFNNYARQLGNISTKVEAAMALAQILLESDGLRAKLEYACAQSKCPNSYRDSSCDRPDAYYFGRGYIQLTWCYNYGLASQAIFGDDRLLNNPDLVAQDDKVAWQTAFWFWGYRVHNEPGVQQGRFGATTKAINGGIECQAVSTATEAHRFDIYINVRRAFGLRGIPNPAGCADVSLVSGDDVQSMDVTKPTLQLVSNEESIYMEPSNTNLVLFVIFIMILLIVASLSVTLYIRSRKFKRVLSDDEIREFFNGRRENTEAHIADNCLINSEKFMDLKFDQRYALSKENIVTDTSSVLGSGNFGVVYRGTMNDTPVAIKHLKRKCTTETFKSFLLEVKVHSHIGKHQNVVNLLGAYIREIRYGVLYVVTEICQNGSLESLLRKTERVKNSNDQTSKSELSLVDLNRFCYEISCGMEHITSKKVVHGDLSARNILLDSRNTCKIADFGLSRKLYEYDKYVKKSQEPIPWKLMAYETLIKMEFTCKSDVWSFGITAWEIFSLGKIPYAGLSWTVDFTDELLTGLRLPKPVHASDQIYKKVLECWEIDPKRRPNFSDLVQFFQTSVAVDDDCANIHCSDRAEICQKGQHLIDGKGEQNLIELLMNAL
ncbi:Fibroblast growth factor receptor [Orchesella cincta]|uniref:Fibroblast growth factor receptor n=1 Tax=Orchesella cincta TaxID=48709 RepID=A0A1D2N1Y0_ORCCI|nr:Fibroblast growth factor receptor [Orchesella cincta]